MGLWVICPECGPLVALLPQRGAFYASIKCSGCGLKIDHEEVLPTANKIVANSPVVQQPCLTE